jgi:hypothetical protein
MARHRQIQHLTPGEYVATVTWVERIGNRDFDRCAEHAGVKVTGTWVAIYPDAGDPEKLVRLARRTNKSAQVYVDMSIEEMVRERTINWCANSTKCCNGRGFGASGCKVHTKAWLNKEIKTSAANVRAHMVPEPDREKIEAAYAAERDKRDDSLMDGRGEWRKYKKTSVWCVYALDRSVGDEVIVVRRDGTRSWVRLEATVGEDLYKVTNLPAKTAA